MAIITAPRSADWPGNKEGWVFVDLILTANLAANDTLIFLSANTYGWRIADWTLTMPQIDTNASPTLSVNVGFINAGGTALEVGLEWEQNLTLGRAVAGDFKRATGPGHTLSYGRSRRIGIHIGTAPATQNNAAGKMIRMGIQLAAI